MREFIRRSVRKLRAGYKNWTPEHDRDFFDQIFAAQDFDPFDFAYPGYISIRRFADLVTPFLEGVNSVLDIGCGPAEITCELARDFPDINFFGIDHSAAGIKRAQQNADRLELTNTNFVQDNAEKFLPEKEVDLVCLFDAFHHLMDPAGFVERMSEFTSRFMLLEPRGDWKGEWQRELDLDWLLLDMDKIRARLDFITGESEPKKTPLKTDSAAPKNEPVEQRFSPSDFKGFFKGFGLKMRGTVAGIETYPPGFAAQGDSRRRFGKIVYDLFKDLDEKLIADNLDLSARHWLIYAEKGSEFKKRVSRGKVPSVLAESEVKGPYDAEYRNLSGPEEATAGKDFPIQLELFNRGFKAWSSSNPAAPIFVSYHWRSRHGKTIVQDGLRTPLPSSVSPDKSILVEVKIKAPDKPGKYQLAIDIVCEGTAWFSDYGVPCLHMDFKVK